MDHFELISKYQPTGDQPQAIEALVRGFREGNMFQTLQGVTGSGKTFTMANIIAALNRPTLIISHNKTLAAQLYGEFKEFFPHNAVEFFVSYYDYYQPEAYVPSTDTYIAKDSAVNEEIDRLRLSATASLIERRDVIVVSSVSCIYGLGSPVDYRNMMVSLRPGMEREPGDVVRDLIDIQYTRNEMDFQRGTFRLKGDTLEILPADESDSAYRIEFFGDEIDRITQIDALTGKVKAELGHIAVFPASHYVVPADRMREATRRIEEELEERVRFFRSEDKLLEAQRIAERTNFDIEMLRETGFCSGIENYSRHLALREAGSTPETLMDYFPEDLLILIDESHMTIPQIRAMFHGDQSRKTTLVDYGFRLPSAKDNRPLCFEEFEQKIDQLLFVSATPGPYEAEHELLRAEQVIRPTGLLDPRVEVRPTEGQIDDLISEIRREVDGEYSESTEGAEKVNITNLAGALAQKNTAQREEPFAAGGIPSGHTGNKVMITTLTKKMAEDLTDYLKEVGIRVRYMHSDIDTLERTEIIRDLRMDVFDVLVGINLLREGLDIPEITLIAILDADKEGFLRSETSLIQTIGRAARNVDGHVIMYADTVTDSMARAISETERRRRIQQVYNEEHGITPETIRKEVRDQIAISRKAVSEEMTFAKDPESMDEKELKKLIAEVKRKMERAAADLDFENAALLRDQMLSLRKLLDA